MAEAAVHKLIEPQDRQNSLYREAPNNIEAEQALLGAILINNDAFYRVSDFLKSVHFYEALHRKIFDVCADLIRVGKMASPVTIKTFLPADGDYDLETISNLGVVLHSGALPTTFTVMEERTVASALGQNYAGYGLLTALAALLIVAAFMILSYGLLGLIAIIALAVNVMLVIAVVSVLGIPIGLASIAGLVLTIGMAVDSNILIYEKIREDRRNGFSVVTDKSRLRNLIHHKIKPMQLR